MREGLSYWAVWLAQAGCYSMAAVSSNHSKTLYNMQTEDCISFTQNVLFRVQMEVDIRNYDMHEVVMAPEGKFLYLKVPGLSENR